MSLFLCTPTHSYLFALLPLLNFFFENLYLFCTVFPVVVYLSCCLKSSAPSSLISSPSFKNSLCPWSKIALSFWISLVCSLVIAFESSESWHVFGGSLFCLYPSLVCSLFALCLVDITCPHSIHQPPIHNCRSCDIVFIIQSRNDIVTTCLADDHVPLVGLFSNHNPSTIRSPQSVSNSLPRFLMASTTTHIHINTEVFIMCLFPGKSFLQPLLYLSSKKKLSISTMWFQCYVSVLYLWKHILFYYYTSTFHTQTHRHILFHYIIDTTTFDTPKAIAAQHTTHHNHFMWSSPLSFSFSLCHLPTSTLQQPIV